jgi:2-haloalkanoic acid dehalogenase type II
MIEAVLLDFYGTVVHEDDVVIAEITDEIQAASTIDCTAQDVGTFWWREFSDACASSRQVSFRTQRDIELNSLMTTCTRFGADCDPSALSERLYRRWQQPPIFEDAARFLAKVDLPVVVLSNIDRADIEQAISFHGLAFDHVITSEDVRSYKPHPELFEAGLRRAGVDGADALHVGDSWSSDVLGATALGIPVAWVNRTGRETPDGASTTFEVSELAGLAELVGLS